MHILLFLTSKEAHYPKSNSTCRISQKLISLTTGDNKEQFYYYLKIKISMYGDHFKLQDDRTDS